MLKTSDEFPPVQLDFDPLAQAGALLTSSETALTKVSRTAWATSHHPAGKMIMCCLARLVMKAGVIRRCFCLLLLLLRSRLGHSSRAMGRALSELGSRVPTASLWRTGKQLTLAKLVLLPLLLLPVFIGSDWHWCAGMCNGHIRAPSQSLRRVVWLPGRADVTALPVFARVCWVKVTLIHNDELWSHLHLALWLQALLSYQQKTSGGIHWE